MTIAQILFAITIAATNANEVFRLPSSCPSEVPSEFMFSGTPTNECLKLRPESMSALYAAYTGHWERKVYPFLYYPDRVDGNYEGTYGYRPLQFYIENSDFKDQSPRLLFGFGDYDKLTNRTITTRRLLGWADLTDAIADLRLSLGRAGDQQLGSFCTSLLKPDMKRNYARRWGSDILTILGVDGQEEMSNICWPQIARMSSNDWFVIKGSYDREEMVLNSVCRQLDYYNVHGFDTKYFVSTTNFIDLIEGLVQTNAISQMTNKTSRLLYWRQAGYNTAVASLDMTYDAWVDPDVPPQKGIKYDGLKGYAWKIINTTRREGKNSGGRAFLRNGAISLVEESTSQIIGQVATNSVYEYEVRDIYGPIRFATPHESCILSFDAGIILTPEDVDRMVGQSLFTGDEARIFATVYHEVDPDKFLIGLEAWDANSILIGSARKNLPELFEGEYSIGYVSDVTYDQYETYDDIIYELHTPCGHFSEKGIIVNSDICFTEFLGSKTNNYPELWRSCITGSKVDVRAPHLVFPSEAKSAQEDLSTDYEDFVREIVGKSIDLELDKLKKRLLDASNLSVPAGGGHIVIKKIGTGSYQYEYDGEWLPFDHELQIGYVQRSISHDQITEEKIHDTDGILNGIITYYWDFPNMKLQYEK